MWPTNDFHASLGSPRWSSTSFIAFDDNIQLARHVHDNVPPFPQERTGRNLTTHYQSFIRDLAERKQKGIYQSNGRQWRFRRQWSWLHLHENFCLCSFVTSRAKMNATPPTLGELLASQANDSFATKLQPQTECLPCVTRMITIVFILHGTADCVVQTVFPNFLRLHLL